MFSFSPFLADTGSILAQTTVRVNVFSKVATTLPHGLHDQEGIGLPPYYYFIPFLRYKREVFSP